MKKGRPKKKDPDEPTYWQHMAEQIGETIENEIIPRRDIHIEDDVEREFVMKVSAIWEEYLIRG